MRKFMLIASAAAMSATMPALADVQGKGNGNGRGGDSEQAERGRGPARAERGAERRDQAERRAERRFEEAERGEERSDRARENRAEQRERTFERRAERTERWTGSRAERHERRRENVERFRDDRFWRERHAGRDCPPGLAKQNEFCMPPGQLRKARMLGRRAALSDFGYVPERYTYRFADNDRYLYRYDDGSVYRIARASGLIDTIYPLWSDGLYLGEPMPLGYDVYNVPLAYRSYYPYGADAYYRYDNSAIYRIDPETRLVEGIVALLTGGVGGLGGLGVGDQLPVGYDAYNVPFDYRDRYYDTNDSFYRYADGYIYEVDPETRLIQAVISLFA